MQLSVIIVNYNVKYFLEQCLHSVVKAAAAIETEIFVVDNDSADGSIAYLQPLFPRVKFIANKTNDGFGKANNKALAVCKGKYVLFLNPDTIVPEDCFSNCINFFKQHSSCGALGVQMIDGSGKFLPESKRAYPSLSAAFYKLAGLSLIFPSSKVFNKYALGNLSKDEDYEVDVLAGAFMMLSREVIEQVKGFDEDFFMYGEDIDLSYRVQEAGYKNYYFGKQTIIHFKGESTKRGSLNYVRIFYKAMSVFVNKHYSGSKATLFTTSINIAIWLRALVSLFQNIITKSGMLLIDAIVVYASIGSTKYFWEQFIRHEKFGGFTQYSIPIFTFVFIVGALLSGIYDKLYKPFKALVASISAVVVLLAFYALLPEHYRFSRGVILFGGLLAGIMVALLRFIFIKLNFIKDDEADSHKQAVVVGSHIEMMQVNLLMQKAEIEERLLGRIGLKENEENVVGHITNLKDSINKIGATEIIFCEGSLSFKAIIAQIIILGKIRVGSFRFHAKKSNCIVGSDSKTTTGEALTHEGNYELANPYQKRMKRMIDVWIGFLMLATAPLQFIFTESGAKAIAHAWQVILGKKTWVGYSNFQNNLPLLAPGVLIPSGYPKSKDLDISKTILRKADMLYAKEYDWLQDLRIIFKSYKYLGS